ncbi:unnamed protein product [Rotaria sp. Silwood2]|nr:unnamed protein product [Rotaria sp. Silwood2]
MDESSSSSSLVSINPPSTVPYIKCNFLDKDTDLNEKPVWNNEIALLLSYWLQQRANHDDIFGSFRSANAHTDSLGEVDVISDAEHIKKLLKVPFNKHSQISMIVHRLGRTILLDEFDVHSHLLRLEKNEWTWFRDFFLDTILRNISVKHFYKKNKTRDELIRKDRLVKFLCQSVELPQLTRSTSNNDESQSTETTTTTTTNESTTTTAAALLQQIRDLVNANNNLDDDSDENKNADCTSSPFQRTVNWTFENMKMLIGSDLPIFGDEQHPAVSLRLSNAIYRRAEGSTSSNEKEQTSDEIDQKSKVIVPLPYQTTRNCTKILIDSKNRLTCDQRLKAIILHKAASAYFCLVDRCEQDKNYGSCLHYLRLALNCYSAEFKLQSMHPNNNNSECKRLLSYIMSIAGDCRLMISHVTSTEDFEKFREQYQIMNDIDCDIQNVIDEVGIDENSSEFSWVYELTPIIERNLSASAHAYEYAINIVQNLGDHDKQRLHLLIKRLGNVRNEMGVYWMNQCAQAIKNSDQETTKDIKDLFRKCFENFDAGIHAFEKINDISNIALLHSNLGRLMRYYAQYYVPLVDGIRQEFSQQERQSYHKAFDYYLRGLKLVENRSDLFEIYRTLSWELSNSYFAMAISLQDYAPLSTMSQEDVEKEVIECMTRALKYLEVELHYPSSNRYSLAKYRAGTIHHRLASLLHNAFRTEESKIRRKHLRSLASLHYEKALKLFSPHDNPLEYLRLLIEEVALADFELQNATDNPSRLKYSQQGLRASFQCQETIAIIDQHRISPDPDDYNEIFAQEAQRLLSILNGRIQTFLKEIVKILKITSSKKLIYEDYKEMYSISLRLNDTSATFPRDLYDAIERLKKIYDKNTSD